MMEIEATNREERAELAYAIWSTEAAGSVAKIAELTGFPVPSIQRWKREDNWHRRLASERFGDTNDAVEHAANMIRSAMPQVAERMISIAAGTRPLVNNEGKLVIDPETNELFYFREGKFIAYKPTCKSIKTFKDVNALIEEANEMESNEIVHATTENLPIYFYEN